MPGKQHTQGAPHALSPRQTRGGLEANTLDTGKYREKQCCDAPSSVGFIYVVLFTLRSALPTTKGLKLHIAEGLSQLQTLANFPFEGKVNFNIKQ